MLSLFKFDNKLPESFERWGTVSIIVSSENLASSPYIGKIRNLDQWLDAHGRWQAGYDELVKAEQTLASTNGYTDDFDRRQHEHYAALLLQSGQWLAILLKLLKDLPEETQSRHLQDLEARLDTLRQSLERAMKRA